MTDRPIIFSAPMVRALLEGRKTMTRRLAMATAYRRLTCGTYVPCLKKHPDAQPYAVPSDWQQARPGDRLWVREAWKTHSTFEDRPPRDIPHSKIFYLADPDYSPSGSKERRSFHMPRWASRLTLKVTATKIERLAKITPDDIRLEGLRPATRQQHGAGSDEDLISQWMELWDALNGEGAFFANPEVVALTFTVHLGNIDKVAA